MNDLVAVVPDNDWNAVLQAIVGRHDAVGTRPIAMRAPIVHPQRDPGVRSSGAALLRAFADAPGAHAVLILDREGSGYEGPAAGLEQQLEEELRPRWGDRAIAVVVEPEIEAWLVGGHKHLPEVFGRRGAEPVRPWLDRHGLWPAGTPKPDRPKEALHAWLRAHQRRPVSSDWRKVASAASLRDDLCQCPSFGRFVRQLRAWFPPSP